MVKAERLIYLTQYIHKSGPIRADQLAQELGVSKRTVFRDIACLLHMKVPVAGDSDQGYSITFNRESFLSDISIKDADLVLFCLYHNPLTNSPFFRQRLVFLKEILQKEFEMKSEFKRDSIFSFDSTYIGLAEKHYEKVGKFLFAIYHKSKVFLLEKGSFSKSDALIPIGVRFVGSGATLILFSERNDCEYRVDLEDLQGISISTSNFGDRSRETMEIQRSEIKC